MGGLTRRFVDHLVATHDDVMTDPGVLPRMDALVADGLAVGLAGAAEPGPSLLAEQALAAYGDGGKGGATLLARCGTLPPIAAARVNGAAMHVLDFEPMWNPANHSVSTVLPALLALAETGDARRDGRALVAALAIGIEAQTRLRRASRQFEPGDLVFHPPSVVGPIGSAVACGLFLGLNHDALCHAVGIAASRAGGVLANVGTMTKALHCGGAAADGFEAALLAARGFTADPDALAGSRGYLNAFFGGEPDTDALTVDAPLSVLDPGPAFKFYPSQYGTHFVITAALDLAPLTAGAEIENVTITCPPMPYVDRPSPSSGLAGKFSFQYVVAASLLDGQVNLATFSDARRFAADMDSLLPRISISPDQNRPGRFDQMRVDIDVRLSSGVSHTASCDGPPGIWGRPPSEERLSVKLRDCLKYAGLPEELERNLTSVSAVEGEGLRHMIGALGISRFTH